MYLKVLTIGDIQMNTKVTREEVLAKFRAAKTKKQESLVKIEKYMREEYKKQTGQEAKYFFAM